MVTHTHTHRTTTVPLATHAHQGLIIKALKCKPLAEFGANIGIFGLKTPLYAYVLGEHTSMKNEL